MFESYFSALIKIFNLTVGYSLLIVGFIIGVGFGLGWALIGGMMELVASLKMNPIEISQICISILRILFSYFLGYLAGGIFYEPAMKIFNYYSREP